MKDVRRTNEPHDRLTALCAAMTEALDAHPWSGPDVRCVVFLQDGRMGGLQIHGYQPDDDAEDPDVNVSAQAVADVFSHLKAIFHANGQELQIHPMPNKNPRDN
jgi:hypothetical protein